MRIERIVWRKTAALKGGKNEKLKYNNRINKMHKKNIYKKGKEISVLFYGFPEKIKRKVRNHVFY